MNMSSQVIIGKTCKRVTLQRSLVSLILYDPQKVTLKHLLVLYENMLWFQQKCEKDLQFQEKFGITLKVLAIILKRVDFSNKTVSPKNIEFISKQLQGQLGSFVMPRRNYEQPLKQQMAFVEVRPTRSEGVPTKNLKPKAHIGIGYRDKGTAKKPELDGSPSWQEVASSTIKEIEKWHSF